MGSITRGREIWEGFERFLKTDTDDNLIVYYTKVLFQQACNAIDLGVHLGTAVLCRSSLETAFYLSLFGRWEDGEFHVESPRNTKGKVRQVSFEELQVEISKIVDFPQNELDAIERIQKDGNLVAHLAAIRIEKAKEWDRAAFLGAQQLLQTNPTPEGWRQFTENLDKNSGIWVNPAQALYDLRDTSSILKTLLRKFSQTRIASIGVGA